ncbi:MAG TPA: ArsB/NhaD family transporter [Bacillales bacterium]|nr:ArsB/NhaD family transporter [Bacillales bacterium]
MESEASNLQIIIAVVVFVLAYAFIISEKVNRTLIALAGAAVILFFGVIEIHSVFVEHMEWGTIVLLIGMMILVGITNKSGVFQYAAVRSAKMAKGEPMKILIILSILTAVGSAFLDNVTTVLLVVPVTFSITRILGVNPIPFLISEILFSNIGGTATLIGDPPNIMIGAATGLSFNAFLFNLAPVVIVIGAVTLVILYFIYRKHMKADESKQAELMALDEKEFIRDVSLMRKSLFVLGGTILAFVLHSIIGIEAPAIAMSGATCLMLIGVKENDFEEVFHSVEWGTIFFFAGLFTLVGGLVEVGVIEYLASGALEITGGDLTIASIMILWVSGVASATIDNIPYVATMIPLIQDMIHGMGLEPGSYQANILWWSLALGACLGGNGTLIGASANVIVAGMASKEGDGFTYMDFLKIGAPITLVSLVLSNIYLYLRYLI